MSPELLSTKLHLPLLRKDYVPRPRLLARLNEALRDENRLILICAPAGYGKTTLLCEWHRSLNGSIPFGWVALDEDDNDPARFSSYFLTALELIFPGRFSGLKEEMLSPGISSMRIWIPALINRLDPAESDFVLVLDDFHLIHSKAIQDGLAYFLDHVPPCMHLVISSRQRPYLPTARMYARAQMTSFLSDDLRFNEDEMNSFLNHATFHNLPEEDLIRLKKEIDGWAAGLQLAAFHIRQEHSQPGSRELHFSGAQGEVFDFLVEEVLKPLPEYVTDFLYKTSILERINADLAAALTGRADTQATLERLVEENLFTSALDEEGRWFRYHHLFSEALQRELGKKPKPEITALHCTAGNWYEEHGDLRPAMHHYLLAEEHFKAAQLLDQNASHFFLSGEVVSVLDWVERIPDEIENRFARLRAVLVWGHFLTGENILAQEEINIIRREFPDEIAGDAILRGYLLAMESIYMLYVGDWKDIVRSPEDLIEYMNTGDRFLDAIVKFMLGLFYFMRGEPQLSAKALIECVETSRTTGNLLLTHFSILTLGMSYILQGKYRMAEKFFELSSQVDEALLDSQEEVPIINICIMGKGEVLREWNRLDEAEQLLERSIRYGKRWGNAEFYIDAYGYLARVRSGMGNLSGALAAIEDAEMLIYEGKVSRMTARSIAAQKARVLVQHGNLDAVQKWADECAPDYDGSNSYGVVGSYLSGMEELTIARLLIGRGRLREAEAALLSQRERLEDSFCQAMVIENLILLAYVYDAQGRQSEAFELLYECLQASEPEGMVRHYLDEGAALIDLLRRFQREKQTHAEAYGAVSDAYLNTLCGGNGWNAGASDGLSARETEVLTLIGQGASNREIAEMLSIAPSTVKTHINHLHDKLHTRSRTKLLLRARDLGLIP